MSMRLAQATVVNLASIVTLKGSGRLLCPGLGSCVAICGLDPVSGLGGIAHLMLPQAPEQVSEALISKFVDSGLKAFITELEQRGATVENLRFAASGGAQLFSFGVQNQSDLGSRNAEAVKEFMSQNSLELVAVDLGGSSGRSLSFTIETGEVLVRTLAQGERELCNLRSPKSA